MHRNNQNVNICCSKCGLQTSKPSIPWEGFREAGSQALPQTYRKQNLYFSRSPGDSLVRSSLGSSVGNYAWLQTEQRIILFDWLRRKENVSLKLDYFIVSQMEEKVHILLFFTFLKIMKAQSIYCLEHRKCLNWATSLIWCRWQCSWKVLQNQTVALTKVKWW